MATTSLLDQGGGNLGLLGGLLGGAQFGGDSSPGLLGQGPNDPKSAATMALAAGMISGNLAGGLNAYAQLMSPEAQLKRGLMSAQYQDVLQQIEMRKQQAAQLARRNDMINGWMGQLKAAPSAANQAVIDQTGNLAPTTANAALQAQEIGKATAGNPMAGVDPNAVYADLAFNDGKNIPEWMFKRSTPDMQNVNGVWMDKNKVQNGESIPQMSPTGQGYQIVKDATAPNGYRVVSPAGANELQLQNTVISSGVPKLIDAALTPKDIKNAAGQTVTMSNLQALDKSGALGSLSTLFPGVFGATAPQSTPVQPTPQTAPQLGPQGTQRPGPMLDRQQFNADPLARKQAITAPDPTILQGELKRAVSAYSTAATPEEKQRAQGDIDSLTRQMKTAGISADGFVSGPTTAQDQFNKSLGEKNASQVDDAMTKALSAKQALPAIWNAKDILKAGTFNGMGADTKLNLVRSLSALGIPVPDSVANSQTFDATLAQIAGKNIKSIVGSQNISNSDVNFVRQMFGTRGQEANAIKFLLDKAEEANFRDISNYNGLSKSATGNGGQSMLGEITPPARPQGGATTISSDAEYNALPPGTLFTGPDGKSRRKP